MTRAYRARHPACAGVDKPPKVGSEYGPVNGWQRGTCSACGRTMRVKNGLIGRHVDFRIEEFRKGDPMPQYVFTFPQHDQQRRDSYVTVNAADETAARETIIDLYGRNGWAFCYPSEEAAGVAKYGLTKIDLGA